jgi:hypothetical protein
MKRFLEGRLNIAKALSSDVPGASYADVVLIITTILSACASLRWSGRGIDRKRFIELLVKQSKNDFHTSWVSIPALINQRFISEKEAPYRRGNSTRIFRGEEIDLPLDKAREQYPNLPLKKLKENCYASLIYERLRCGYAHEYCSHEDITHVPASRHKSRVSYIGRTFPGGDLKRMVSFHLDYLMDIAKYHVSNISSKKSSPPETWWILDEGKQSGGGDKTA